MNLGELVAEQWLARRLQIGLNWDSGVTTREQRRDLIRRAILLQGLANERAGFRRGYPETWEQLFERVFRQPLIITEQTTDAV